MTLGGPPSFSSSTLIRTKSANVYETQARLKALIAELTSTAFLASLLHLLQR